MVSENIATTEAAAKMKVPPRMTALRPKASEIAPTKSDATANIAR